MHGMRRWLPADAGLSLMCGMPVPNPSQLCVGRLVGLVIRGLEVMKY